MTELLKRAEDVAAEIVARLSRCTIALGAETDIGLKVHQGLKRIDDTMIPCAVLIEGDDVPENDRVGTQANLEQQYVVFGYLACDPKDPNVAAHKALRDLKRAIFTTDGKPDRRFGRRVLDVRYLGRDIGARTDGAGFVLAAVEFSVSYVEDLASP